MDFSLFKKFGLCLSLVFFVNCSMITNEKEIEIQPPEELYGDLFYEVQENKKLFEDSKTFVDVVPLYNVDYIKDQFSKLENKSPTMLSDFVQLHFLVPERENDYETDSLSINRNITELWEVLKRPADPLMSGTLIPLPNPYLVPGGRFREIYYWDSYFTMLGLKEDGEVEIVRDMLDNFAHLINEYGFIPNGNRTYYLSRSQPPFFALMVELLAEVEGEHIYEEYLWAMEQEYEFWMEGTRAIGELDPAHKRVVKLPDGEILNRYWDAKNTPRPESYREDVITAEEAVSRSPDLQKEEVYRNIRAAAESGWDFSSRWLKEDETGGYPLSTIHTTDILPVDLNSLLYNLEKTLATACELSGFSNRAKTYRKKYETRQAAILKYFWDEEKKFFMDYNFREHQATPVLSLAGVYPLFFEIATKDQAENVSDKIEEVFLKPGGLITTTNTTGQQWDAPNGWAPLQWIAIRGLRNYGESGLAEEIKSRWLNLNRDVYQRTYKMLEKYNVEDLSKESGGGEYPTQDGFGWTNGVYQKLSAE